MKMQGCSNTFLMAIVISVFFVFTVMFVMTSTAFAQTTYYVSTDGNDANNGSLEYPWATITYGITQIQGGDTLVVMEGTYSITSPITISHDSNPGVSGSEVFPTKIIAQDNVILELQTAESYIFNIIGTNTQKISYLIISGFRFTRSTAFKTCAVNAAHVENCSIQNNMFSGFSCGVDLENSIASNISANQFKECTAAVNLYLGADNIFSNNKYINGGRWSILLSDTHRTIVKSNYFSGNTSSGIGQNANWAPGSNINIKNCADTYIENNYFSKSYSHLLNSSLDVWKRYTAYGIVLRQEMTRTIVKNNFFDGNGILNCTSNSDTQLYIHNNQFHNANIAIQSTVLPEEMLNFEINNNVFTGEARYGYQHYWIIRSDIDYYWTERDYTDKLIYVRNYTRNNYPIGYFTAQNFEIKNNIVIYDNDSLIPENIIYLDNNSQPADQIDSNYFDNRTISITNCIEVGQNNIFGATPMFRNESIYNVQLLPGSPCIGSGADGATMGVYGGEYAFIDADNDGLPDDWEQRYSLDTTVQNDTADTDNDGVTDYEEFWRLLNPANADTDNDGMTDGWELKYGFLPYLYNNERYDDPDSDGLTNEQESSAGTNPYDTDSDNDGLSDGDETMTYQTDPLNPDTDGDGISDGKEVLYSYDPLNRYARTCLVALDECPADLTGSDASYLLSWIESSKNTLFYSVYAYTGTALAKREILHSNVAKYTVSSNGKTYLVIWQNDDFVCKGVLLSMAGDIILPEFIIDTQFSDIMTWSVAYNDNNYFVCWNRLNDMDNDSVMGVMINSTELSVSNQKVIVSISDSIISTPVIATNGTTYSIAFMYYDETDDSDKLIQCITDNDGLVTFSEIIPETPDTLDGNHVRLGSNGTSYLLLYPDGNYIKGYIRDNEGTSTYVELIGYSYHWPMNYWPGYQAATYLNGGSISINVAQNTYFIVWEEGGEDDIEAKCAQYIESGDTFGDKFVMDVYRYPCRFGTASNRFDNLVFYGRSFPPFFLKMSIFSPGTTSAEYGTANFGINVDDNWPFPSLISSGANDTFAVISAVIKVQYPPYRRINLSVIKRQTDDDIDLDGLTDDEEFAIGSSPTDMDSDNDGFFDSDELLFFKTNPLRADSDNDGISDYDEINIHNTNPLLADSDNDGISDYDEIELYLTDANNTDTDNDGISDSFEVNNGLDPLNAYIATQQDCSSTNFKYLHDVRDVRLASSGNMLLVSNFARMYWESSESLFVTLMDEYGYPMKEAMNFDISSSLSNLEANDEGYLCSWYEKDNCSVTIKGILFSQSGDIVAEDIDLLSYQLDDNEASIPIWTVTECDFGFYVTVYIADTGTMIGCVVYNNATVSMQHTIMENLQSSPSITSNGAKACIAWNEIQSDNDGEILYAQFIDNDGILLGEPIVVEQTAAKPILASNGSGFLVVWHTATNIYAKTLDANGNLNQAVAIDGNSIYHLHINAKQDEYFILWSDTGISEFYTMQETTQLLIGQKINVDGGLKGGQILIKERIGSMSSIGGKGDYFANDLIVSYCISGPFSPIREYLFIDATNNLSPAYGLNNPTGFIPIFTAQGGKSYWLLSRNSYYNNYYWLNVLRKQTPDDYDADGVKNSDEPHYGLNMFAQDTDNDGCIDTLEVLDFDNDGLKDSEEFYQPSIDYEEGVPLNTDRLNPDTDNDGWTDGEEVNVYHTNPLCPYLETDFLKIADQEAYFNCAVATTDVIFGLPQGYISNKVYIYSLHTNQLKQVLLGNEITDKYIATDGTNALVVRCTEDTLFGTLVDPIGNVIRDNFIMHSFEPTNPITETLSLASNGDNYLVSWLENDSVHGIYFDNDGATNNQIVTLAQDEVIQLANNFYTKAGYGHCARRLWSNNGVNNLVYSDTVYIDTEMAYGRLYSDTIIGALYNHDGALITDNTTIFPLWPYSGLLPSGTFSDVFFLGREGKYGSQLVFLDRNGQTIGKSFTVNEYQGKTTSFAGISRSGNDFIAFFNCDGALYARYYLNPDADSDSDNLYNKEEFIYGTDMRNPDSDGDGLTDHQEIVVHNTDPRNPDSDGDGVNDAPEIQAGTNPKDSNSVFRLIYCNYLYNINEVMIQWEGSPDKSYKVLFKELSQNQWQENPESTDIHYENGIFTWCDTSLNASAGQNCNMRVYKIVIE